MAKLHIIYDPRDRISHSPELNKQMGVKVAMIDLADEEVPEDTARRLVNLLLEQLGYRRLVA